MGDKILMKGAEVIGEAAVKAGCRLFFGYPITPQNEAPAYMAKRLPEVGGTFVQAESEVAAINMLYGASAAGHRVMTSSSSPGISLMMEGISYCAGSELPIVIVNVMRGGPGLGGIGPSQSDYFQSTKGGGHGDYRMITLAPTNLQEQADLMKTAFDLADLYRIPVMVLSDGLLGQIMEAVEFNFDIDPASLPNKEWAANGRKNREKHLINSLDLDLDGLEHHNEKLQARYKKIEENEVLCEDFLVDDAKIVIVAYGTTARIAKTAVEMMREEGYKVGLIRPITLWPFPVKNIQKSVQNSATESFYVFEMNAGQMLEDVQIVVNGKKPIRFFGRMGGNVPSPIELISKIKEIY
ncbi:MAG TPA: 3-methyl-2-oxobutanoate dehydrogenase subunit VorB [Caldisericia bacterium]|jgi:2-oxoglutarate ferredoxin oxidoreductase subunit alpha|nr:3-methyl-2-oxobutanoate dehydrogenase subunit VorB [Caldisericia bacterium]HXK50930.1 3-methyl-2-oxobutanoate dehydrogenase subunit VorB [Caldisericia bacterium]